MKTPMKNFLGSPLLSSNMLQTLFPTSIPLIRINLALYLLYDFFSRLPFFFPLTPLFRERHFFGNLYKLQTVAFSYASAISTSPFSPPSSVSFPPFSSSAFFPLSASASPSFSVSSSDPASSASKSTIFSVSLFSSSSSSSSSSCLRFSVFIVLNSSLMLVISALTIRISSVALAFVSLIHCLVVFVFLRSFSASLSIFINCLVAHSLHSLSAFFSSYRSSSSSSSSSASSSSSSPSSILFRFFVSFPFPFPPPGLLRLISVSSFATAPFLLRSLHTLYDLLFFWLASFSVIMLLDLPFVFSPLALFVPRPARPARFRPFRGRPRSQDRRLDSLHAKHFQERFFVRRRH